MDNVQRSRSWPPTVLLRSLCANSTTNPAYKQHTSRDPATSHLKNLIKHNESKAVGNTVPLLAWSPWGGQYKAIQPSNTSDRLTFISSPHVHHIHHVLGDITHQKNTSREVEFLDSCPIQNTIAVEIRRLKQKLFMLLHFTPDSVPTLMAVLKSSSAT